MFTLCGLLGDYLRCGVKMVNTLLHEYYWSLFHITLEYKCV